MKWLSILVVASAIVGCGSSRPSSTTVSTTEQTPPATTPPAQVTTNTPAGSAPGSALSTAGVPTYPGVEVKGQAATPGAEGESRFNVMLTSQDAPETVASYYEKELKFKSSTKDGVTTIVGRTAQKADVIIQIEKADRGSKITVRGIRYANAK